MTNLCPEACSLLCRQPESVRASASCRYSDAGITRLLGEVGIHLAVHGSIHDAFYHRRNAPSLPKRGFPDLMPSNIWALYSLKSFSIDFTVLQK